MIRVIPLDTGPEASLSPDIVWIDQMGDFALAPDSDQADRYGLKSRQHLATAVAICLMTDRAVAPDELPPGARNRGWPGDAFDLDLGNGERPLGSTLWLLERSTVNAVETPRFAERSAREALQTLIDQGVAARVEARATARPEDNRLDLDVALYGRDGNVIHDQKFAVLWSALDGVSYPLAG